MKKLSLIASAFSLVAGMALAQATHQPKSAAHKTMAAKGKMHDVKAEFVSFDATAKTITVKDDKGQSQTVPLDTMAADQAKSLKPGEKVTLTCRDNEKGEHQAITAIKPSK